MPDSTEKNLFLFNDAFASLVAADGSDSPVDGHRNITEADLREALRASGETAYRWDIDTDRLIWSANAPSVLGCAPHVIATGKQFSAMLDGDNVTNRYETVMNAKARDDGNGVPYQIEYMFRSGGRKNASSIWLEDVGHWSAGPDGNPKTAFGIVRRVDERHKREQRLTFLGNCDPMTGMMNRGRMTEVLGESIASAMKDNTNCAFLIAAVNNLTLVNEAYGYEVADEVIVAVGRRLRQVVRQEDVIARYSGSKFGIIINDCSNDEMEIALQRFMSVARDSVIETMHGPVWVAMSIGAIMLPSHADTATRAISLAEEALYLARKHPSDDFVVFKPSDRIAKERALNARCANEIVSALKEDKFKLAFQPIVNAKTDTVDLHEALLRLEDASGELIAASHLVPIAENLGLVRLVDRAVMRHVLQTLELFPKTRIAMNISAATATDHYWYDQMLKSIAAHAKVAPRLIIEITETVALRDIRATRHFVERLREAGCGVAIDDFGAGYTSFRNLRDLPVTILKLDGSFSRDLTTNKDNEYMVKSLIDLSQKFGLKTIAEWVETEEDCNALKSWGIDYLQGHYLGEASTNTVWSAVRAPQTKVPVPELTPAPLEHEAATPPQPQAAEIDFTEIDESISRLRGVLKELGQTKKEAKDQSSESAA